MRRHALAVSVVLALAGCGGSRPLGTAVSHRTDLAEAGSDASAIPSEAPIAGDAGTLPPPAPAPHTEAPCAKMVLADACITQPWVEPIDREAWFSSRGAKAPVVDLPESSCHEITLGPAKEAALRCQRLVAPSSGKAGTPGYTFRTASSEVIYVMRARRPVVVFEKLVHFDLFDKEDLTVGPLFALNVEIGNATDTIVLSEPASGACAEARKRSLATIAEATKESRDYRPVALAWARFDDQLLKRICDAVGRYVWKDGAFVRVRETEAGASSL